MSGGRIVAAVFGALFALVAVAMLTAGAGLSWAWATQRTDDGYFQTDEIEFVSDGYAVTSQEIDLGARPGDWRPSGVLGTVRLSAAGEQPLFVGIGPSDDVAAYLADVRHHEVTELNGWDPTPSYRAVDGPDAPAPPEAQSFWVASGVGSLQWQVDSGEWAVVLMNADASEGVTAEVVASARIDWLIVVIVAVLAAGVVLALVAAVLLVIAVRRPGAPAVVGEAQPAPTGEYGRYPVLLEGDLDEPLSRWLWLVKWLLAIPHYIVLAFLWTAMFVLEVIVFFAILFTGRYPRGLFDFNVGVLRWTWRVSYYTYSALGTDRYPPFALSAGDYPARLDVPYPERLSRGLVLVKWWLLAIPHYIIIGFFTTGLVWWATDVDNSFVLRTGGGLIGLLVFVAAIALLFTGRYPGGLFDLIMGLNRWVFRVAAYVLLMRDEYPPFHLDMGGREVPAQAAGTEPDGGGGDGG